jgi:hypothetical protein
VVARFPAGVLCEVELTKRSGAANKPNQLCFSAIARSGCNGFEQGQGGFIAATVLFERCRVEAREFFKAWHWP